MITFSLWICLLFHFQSSSLNFWTSSAISAKKNLTPQWGITVSGLNPVREKFKRWSLIGQAPRACHLAPAVTRLCLFLFPSWSCREMAPTACPVRMVAGSHKARMTFTLLMFILCSVWSMFNLTGASWFGTGTTRGGMIRGGMTRGVSCHGTSQKGSFSGMMRCEQTRPARKIALPSTVPWQEQWQDKSPSGTWPLTRNPVNTFYIQPNPACGTFAAICGGTSAPFPVKEG